MRASWGLSGASSGLFGGVLGCLGALFRRLASSEGVLGLFGAAQSSLGVVLGRVVFLWDRLWGLLWQS